ncbi:MAG: CBS domain-containing protein [Candidatus Omnitrophica bacterium]|nr:CBS domain-containing protein [Candidatus Omnitrophota bacterium]
MFTADMVMTKKVYKVKKGQPLKDAMEIMLSKKIRGIPVVDDANNLVGIITESDMLKILIDDDINDADPVENFMTKDVKCFNARDKIMDIFNYFIESPRRRVPILKDGKLVGIISRRDLISLIRDLKKRDLQRTNWWARIIPA